jgi:hypothetical protein
VRRRWSGTPFSRQKEFTERNGWTGRSEDARNPVTQCWQIPCEKSSDTMLTNTLTIYTIVMMFTCQVQIQPKY